MMMKMFHVYEDWTTEATPRCFYVGKGDDNRVAKLRRANDHHTKIASTLGQRREIIFSTSIEEETLKLERKLIQERHTHPRDPDYNGIGCNRTIGGQGASGRIVSKETCMKISVSKKGKTPKKIWTQAESDATSKRMSLLHKGKKLSEEHRQLLSSLMHDPIRYSAMKQNVSDSLRMKYMNDKVFAQKIQQARTGENNSRSVLTEAVVRSIRIAWNVHDFGAHHATKKFCSMYAEKFGVTPTCIHGIVKYRTWKHVE